LRKISQIFVVFFSNPVSSETGTGENNNLLGGGNKTMDEQSYPSAVTAIGHIAGCTGDLQLSNGSRTTVE